MKETKKQPKLRFPGFTDDWEQRKLNDVAKFSKGNGYSKGDLCEEGTPIILYGRLYTNYETTISSVDTFVEEKENSIFSKGGEVIIPASGETAEDIARASAVENSGILLGGDLNIIEPDENINSSFLAISISNGDCQKELAKKAQGKSVVHVRNDEIKRLTIPFPNKAEQNKIVSYFQKVDNLITLHQRELDSVKKLKQSMLQKMFPRKGEAVPELRFPGFTGAWEQRKLKDIANKITTKNKNTQYVETFTNSAELGIISQREFFDHDVSNIDNISSYYVVEEDAFVYNPRISTNAPVGPINRNKLGRIGVMSPLYTVFKTHTVSCEYLEWFFKSTRWHAFMKFNGDSGARSDRFSIKDAVFFEMPIPIPEMDEQIKIGQYLTNLDNLITLHQRELDGLKKLKKAFLQHMFV